MQNVEARSVRLHSSLPYCFAYASIQFSVSLLRFSTHVNKTLFVVLWIFRLVTEKSYEKNDEMFVLYVDVAFDFTISLQPKNIKLGF